MDLRCPSPTAEPLSLAYGDYRSHITETGQTAAAASG
jgi:hypothetical protein